ncbi:MAG TPA: hypothetical protein DCE43_08705 [Planctomycetaceae bacterium]|nr:hypothetical protein [Planctomycetaceae bacterium]HCK54132.1 hypothetical protein [Planctomycetaceae bacterium]|tara:strand:+ start:1740 stop:2951 length:1212 start_codon:yes stop_codon:yes gene_type:complete
MTVSSAKSLDRKLAAIAADPSGCREFILADAKDADMAFGMGAPGLSPERHDSELQFRSLAEYRDQMRQIVQGGLVDIMLMSASTNEELTIRERLFDGTEVTPAVRANDTTDIHVVRGGKIHEAASKPFQSASIDHIQCGHLDCEVPERSDGADLGLYSVTFANNRDDDLRTIEAYRVFRDEAERKGFRHFLEVFDPNLANCVAPELLPGFINDLIARTLAGVTRSARPLFLKMVYHGPRATEELVNYDPGLVIGILGGSAGTTLDAFQLIHEAQKYGARVALFGRKINNAENQLAFVRFLRLIVDGELEPSEAVRAYHAVLEKLQIKPRRSLEDDLVLETGVMSYGGNEQKTISLPSSTSESKKNPVTIADPTTVDESPDFSAMTPEDRLAYHRSRLANLLGP